MLSVPSTVCPHNLSLHLLPVIPSSLFPPKKLAPSRCNVHVTNEGWVSTWFYNSAVMEDMLIDHYSQFILQVAHDAPNIILAGNVVRV